MRIGRTLYALVLLFLGVMALLVLRYEPWVYTGILDHPILVVTLAGVLALFIGTQVFYRVPDPKRAVIFKGGRFDKIDPRGELMLLPGTEVGAEISLSEQRVRGWPIAVYDCDGKELNTVFGLTFRLVPTAMRPRTEREKRAMLMSNDERRDIIIRTLETALRGIARCLTGDTLKAALVDPDFIEGLRLHICALVEADALTVDRLHLLRITAPEKKEDAKPVRETREVKQTREWTGTAQGMPPSVARALIAGGSPYPPAAYVEPGGGAQAHVRIGGHESTQINVQGDGGRADDARAEGKAEEKAEGKAEASIREQVTREETITRGIIVKPDKDKKDEAPKICERCGQVIVVCEQCSEPAAQCGHRDPAAAPPCVHCGEPPRYCIRCGQPVTRCPHCGAERAR